MTEISVPALRLALHVFPTIQTETLSPGGVQCVLAGWGLISDNGGNANVLQKGEMIVKSHRDGSIQFYTTPAGRNRASGCKGDSGGPLLCPSSNGARIVAGVATGIYSPLCGDADKPMIFATVGPVLDWIQSNM